MVQRVFLDWAHPLLGGLTDWLVSGWEPGPGALDLSDAVVVLPTAGAGRRLRRALAARAEERGSGVLSPAVVTPEVLIAWGCETVAGEMAGKGEQVMAWAAVLTGLNLDDWRALFPVDPVSQDVPWAMSAARDLVKLRRTLEEGGRDLRMAAEALGDENPEAARWEALARLEALAVRRLEAGGWRDPVAVRLAAAVAPVLPDGVRRVIVAGVPDSIRLTRMVLGAIDTGNLAQVTVVVHAPASLAETFDLWGRPDPAVWMEREIALPEGNRTILLLPGPEDAAAVLMDKLVATGGDPALVAIGSADQEVSTPLRRMAAQRGIRVFDPEGLPLLEHEVSWLVRTVTRMLHSGAWTAAGQFLRLPDVLAAAAVAVKAPDSLKILEEWDDFQEERLPQNLVQAAGLAKDWAEQRAAAAERKAVPGTEGKGPFLPQVLLWVQRLLAELRADSLPEALTELLERVYSEKKFVEGADRQRFVAALQAWQEAVGSVERGAAAFLPKLAAAGRLDLAAALVRDSRLYTAHVDEAQALHGWLELPWQEAPDLMIAGMNEGMVPDSILGDAWLPDSVRAGLDLKTNDTRLARDSYLLTAMIGSRAERGSVRLITGRMSAAGDPLKPSRLLLRCPAAGLPQRALWLFPKESAEAGNRQPAPPWHRAWRLRVPPVRENSPVFQKLSVTAFSDYLKCPFRFYLRHVLGMETFDATRAELDARTIGNLFHGTMEDLHKDPALRDSREEAAIAAFLHARFEARMRETFGRSLTLPVVMQKEVILNCLAKAARIHAEESAKGWRFKGVELTLPSLLKIRGTRIRGRIDLIQQHPEHGYRVLDYKTTSTAEKPADAHLKPVKSKAEQERRLALPSGPWATLEHNGKFYRWDNLQLPLYARTMAAHYRVERVAVGYINLPRAVSGARLEMWENLDAAVLDAAGVCADGVVDSIHQGIFWPPGDGMKYDDFKALIFQDTVSSFDPAELREVRERIASGQFHPVLSPF
ncbi:MAG: PD-(D/E)XK nuclease family protein [Verrucomicrobiota bacterium]